MAKRLHQRIWLLREHSGQSRAVLDRPSLSARVANQNTGFALSCQIAEPQTRVPMVDNSCNVTSNVLSSRQSDKSVTSASASSTFEASKRHSILLPEEKRRKKKKGKRKSSKPPAKIHPRWQAAKKLLRDNLITCLSRKWSYSV